jgi:hypothetical protein
MDRRKENERNGPTILFVKDDGSCKTLNFDRPSKCDDRPKCDSISDLEVGMMMKGGIGGGAIGTGDGGCAIERPPEGRCCRAVQDGNSDLTEQNETE